MLASMKYLASEYKTNPAMMGNLPELAEQFARLTKSEKRDWLDRSEPSE